VDQMFAAVAYPGRHRVGRGVGHGVDQLFCHRPNQENGRLRRARLVKSIQVKTVSRLDRNNKSPLYRLDLT
jgi:hypothetical protein